MSAGPTGPKLTFAYKDGENIKLIAIGTSKNKYTVQKQKTTDERWEFDTLEKTIDFLAKNFGNLKPYALSRDDISKCQIIDDKSVLISKEDFDVLSQKIETETSKWEEEREKERKAIEEEERRRKQEELEKEKVAEQISKSIYDKLSVDELTNKLVSVVENITSINTQQ